MDDDDVMIPVPVATDNGGPLTVEERLARLENEQRELSDRIRFIIERAEMLFAALEANPLIGRMMRQMGASVGTDST